MKRIIGILVMLLITNAASLSAIGLEVAINEDRGAPLVGFIQSLIDSASPGDTINIPSGIYYEHIVINKPLILIGENRDTTIIDGSGIASVVYINANNVTISGFTIQNSGNVQNSDFGIVGAEWQSPNYKNIVITNNKIINNCDGLYFTYYSYITITNNIISDNSHNGVYLNRRCDDAIVSENIINNNTWIGIEIVASDDTEIFDNTITNNQIGIASGYQSIVVNIHNNVIANNDWGIFFGATYDSNIYKNNIDANNIGILIDYVQNTKFEKNNFINNNCHATFERDIFDLFFGVKPRWKNNYWEGHSGFLPRQIPGILYIEFEDDYGNIIYHKEFSGRDYDLRPAKTPYDITTH